MKKVSLQDKIVSKILDSKFVVVLIVLMLILKLFII
jgi:hypothetical protein